MKHQPTEHLWRGIFAMGVAALLISMAQADNYLMQAPTFFQPCKLHDPNNGQCLTNLLQEVFLNWNGDVPGAKAVPSIDPLKLKKINVDQNSPLMPLNLEAKHIRGTGISKALISDCNVQYGEDFKCTLKVPKFHIEGDYAMKGRMLVLDINGSGPLSMDMSDISLRLSFKTETEERDGERFLDLLTLKTRDISIGGIHVRFDNLFGENQDELTDSANDLFNGNKSQLDALITPVLEETIDAFIFYRTNKILRRIPGRYLFTDFP